MLEGFVPFPKEFAAKYREKGYWQDKSLANEFAAVYEKFSDRVALIDGDSTFKARTVRCRGVFDGHRCRVWAGSTSLD